MVLQAQKKYAYYAFGLNIKSDIPLMELIPISLIKENADVNITLDNLSTLWGELANHQGRFLVREKLVAFHIPDTATFCIKDGKNIIIYALEGSEEDKIRLYVLGTCMAVLLMQRRTLTLHGSAVKIEGKAYAIVGNSGAGKSTLATAFINKGYKLLSDDLIPVSISKEGIPFVIPSYPQQKLWQESLQAFGVETTKYRPLFDRETKYAIPVLTNFISEPLPLEGIFELTRTEKTNIELNTIKGLHRFHTLFNHTFRNSLISRMNLMDWHFNESAKIVNKTSFHSLLRPKDGFTAPDLVKKVLSVVKKEEVICLK